MVSGATTKLVVRVERGRAELRVVAESEPGAPPLSLTARFSGGADGVTLAVRHGQERSDFDRRAVAHHPAISGVLRLIADEVEHGKGNNGALLEYLFRSLVVYCARVNTAVPLPRWGRIVRDPRIERAVELLNRDIEKRWTVESLAKAVGLSRAVFARQFLTVLGLSPMRYLTRRRMQVAAALLFASDAGLADVASRVGYTSEFAFNRAFKRYYQVPPGEYRRQLPTVETVAMRLAA
jgi:AraC-like DNA-binding protein